MEWKVEAGFVMFCGVRYFTGVSYDEWNLAVKKMNGYA